MKRLYPISAAQIDTDATQVVQRLHNAGFETYLVGGCVRDLLLGHTPKDFDIATAATPEEVRKTFRNCRIIGRRFRLAHVYFGKKIIETATFRARPQVVGNGADETPLVWRDNEFGSAEEDALRRDFTINGLFYDLSSGKVLDVVDGISDLRRGQVRMIGDPDIRFPEDPVRILRAIKFSDRLGFEIDTPTLDAMIEHRGLIAKCSLARLVEEIYRLLRSGRAAPMLRAMHRFGILAVLFPELSVLLPPPERAAARTETQAVRCGRGRMRNRASADPPSANKDDESDDSSCDRDLAEKLLASIGLAGQTTRSWAANQLWPTLETLDEIVVHQSAGVAPSEPILLAVLIWPLAAPTLVENHRVSETIALVDLLVNGFGARLQIPRRHRDRLKDILIAQERLKRPPSRRKRLTQRDYYHEATQLHYLLRRMRSDQPLEDPWPVQSLSDPPRRRRRARSRTPKPKMTPETEG